MKKSTAQDYAYTERYVELVREGMNSIEARKQAEKEIYGVDIGQPRIRLKSTDAEMLKAYMEEEK